jgi:hypothetical protein
MCFWLAQGGLVLAINILSLLRYLGDTGVFAISSWELGLGTCLRSCLKTFLRLRMVVCGV